MSSIFSLIHFISKSRPLLFSKTPSRATAWSSSQIIKSWTRQELLFLKSRSFFSSDFILGTRLFYELNTWIIGSRSWIFWINSQKLVLCDSFGNGKFWSWVHYLHFFILIHSRPRSFFVLIKWPSCRFSKVEYRSRLVFWNFEILLMLSRSRERPLKILHIIHKGFSLCMSACTSWRLRFIF